MDAIPTEQDKADLLLSDVQADYEDALFNLATVENVGTKDSQAVYLDLVLVGDVSEGGVNDALGSPSEI